LCRWQAVALGRRAATPAPFPAKSLSGEWPQIIAAGPRPCTLTRSNANAIPAILLLGTVATGSCARSWSFPMLTVWLSYDKLGTRLKRIGEAKLKYDRFGTRARRVGDLQLDYDSLGARLRSIGGLHITYDRLGTRARTLGAWHLVYGQLGTRLSQVGPYKLTYDRLGSRVRTIGPMRLEYDRFGTRARSVLLATHHGELPQEDLAVLFLVLYREEEEEQDARS
jgi:hypothetical protein